MVVEHKCLLLIILSCIVIGITPMVTEETDEGLEWTTEDPDDTIDEKQETLQFNEKDKAEAIKAFEASLLNLFGLSSRPKPSQNTQIPQYMLDMYARQFQDSESDNWNSVVSGKGTNNANTVRSFLHTDPSERDSTLSIIHFNVSTIPSQEELTSAELRLYREAILELQSSTANQHSPKSYKLRIEVHEVMKPARRGREAITRIVDVKNVDVRNTSWETFDIHPAVLKWKQFPHLNHGLEVRLESRVTPPTVNKSHIDNHVRLRRSASVPESQWHSQRPLLVTYTDDGRSPRTRRSNRRRTRSRNSRRKARRNQCRRHSLYVHFNDVGWDDWIVAPAGYQAYYCHGECPFPLADHLNSTNHAIVQTLVNSVNPAAVPKACCVPTELSSISMLYLDEYDKVVLKNYQDMVVEGCGCR